jgi:hypothetical protein
MIFKPKGRVAGAIGFRSLNDAIDTTTAQGRLVFNLFASLAEFDGTGHPEGFNP